MTHYRKRRRAEKRKKLSVLNLRRNVETVKVRINADVIVSNEHIEQDDI